MTKKSSAGAMLRHADRGDVFQRDGEVMTFWFAETAGGRQRKLSWTSRRRCPRSKLVIDLGLRLADGDFTEPTTRTNEPAATWQAAPG